MCIGLNNADMILVSLRKQDRTLSANRKEK